MSAVSPQQEQQSKPTQDRTISETELQEMTLNSDATASQFQQGATIMPQSTIQSPVDEAILSGPLADTEASAEVWKAAAPQFGSEETIMPTAPSQFSQRPTIHAEHSTSASPEKSIADARQQETICPSALQQSALSQAANSQTLTQSAATVTYHPGANSSSASSSQARTEPQSPESVAAAAAKPAQKPKKTINIAGYEVLGVLGRGGMGVVYKARHLKLNRLVALKMMLSGAHSSAEERARFRIEAEAVARLQHPNIVQIYEIGEQDGKPFFSLEYLQGGSLEKKLNGTPQATRRAAEQVEKLARAMFVAHQAGIIHRDLKPANILLLPNGEPKVTDFGLAKNIDGQDGQTQSGAIMGTPSYMAPEQAAGKTKELGPAADIYSLGAILYDLITGRPPFKGETVMDTLNQVQSIEPLPPVRLQPTVPRDLETICLKCLQKEPQKRYATAQDFADDLHRFLEGEPITARPIGTLERTVKWGKRHPAAAALVVVSTAAVLALGIGGVVFARNERQRAEEAVVLRHEAEENARIAQEQEQVARQMHALADQERQRAEGNFKQARAAVDQMLTRVSQNDLANEPRMEKIRRELLQKALGFYEGFVQQKSDDPIVRWETGRAQQRVGDIQEMLGQHEAAARAYRSAATILGQLAAAYPQQPDYRQDLAVAQNNLGIVLQAAGQREAAEEAYRQSLTAKAKLVADFPAVPTYRRELASSYNNRAILLQTHNKPREAEDAYRQAAALFNNLTNEDPDKADYRQELARTYANLGVLLQTTNRPRKAEESYRKAAAAQEALAKRYPRVADYQKEQGRSLFNLGVLLQLNGEAQKAEKAYRQAEDIFVRLSHEFPNVPDYRHELAVSDGNLGNLLQELRRPQEAEKLWLQARELLSKLVTEVQGVPIYRQELARNQNELGILWASTGHIDRAEEAWSQALALQTALAAEFPREPAYRQELARSHGNFGILMTQLNRHDKAKENYRKAIDLLDNLERQFPAVTSYTDEAIVNSSNLASLLAALGQKQEAAKSWRYVISRQEKLVTGFPRSAAHKTDLARSQNTLANLLLERSHLKESRELLRSAITQQTRACRIAAQNSAYRELLCGYYLNLSDAELSVLDHAAASKVLNELLSVAPASWGKYQRVGCLLAACATTAQHDSNLTVEQRQKCSQTYSQQAVGMLRKAQANGYKDVHFLKTVPELDALRSRDDFKKLLVQMESKTTVKAPAK